jgi:hypothetical protein
VSHLRGLHAGRIHQQETTNINHVVDVPTGKSADGIGMVSPFDVADARTATPGPGRDPLPSELSSPVALTGLAGVAFYLSGVFLPGRAPKPDAATPEVVAYLVHHRSTLLTGFALQLVALALLLCFLGQLGTLIASAGGAGRPAASTMTAGWVVLISIVAMSMLPATAIVWRGAASTSADLVRLAYDMQTLGSYAVSATAAMVSVAAPSIIIWRSRVLPRWIAVLGAAAVAANAVELLGLSSRSGSLAGGYIDGAGLLLWAVWVAAASGCLALRLRRNRQAAR